MISPAAQFRKEDKEGRWGWIDFVDSDRFQKAASAALTEMQLQNLKAPDMASAAAWHWRMEGAIQFLQILMALTQEVKKESPLSSVNLRHNA